MLSNGSVQCWGTDSIGSYGFAISTAHFNLVPVNVSGISNAVAVAAGPEYSCALLSTGSVQCWGYDSNGPLGNGSATDGSVPVTLPGVSNAIALANTCALLSTGSIQCWAYTYNGYITGSTDNVSVITNAVAVTNTCALLNTGSIQCWGDNYFGQLGIGASGMSWVQILVFPCDHAAMGSDWGTAS